MKNPLFSGYLYGHPVHIEADEFTLDEDGVRSYTAWRFSDTDELADNIDKLDLVCPKCGKSARATNGDDPCIANLPGVKAACCGHGVEDAYILFDDGKGVRGDQAECEIKRLRKLNT